MTTAALSSVISHPSHVIGVQPRPLARALNHGRLLKVIPPTGALASIRRAARPDNAMSEPLSPSPPAQLKRDPVKWNRPPSKWL